MFLKDPDATLDFSCDWSAWVVEGDQITTSEWVVPTSLEATRESLADNVATVWLAGGEAGETVRVVNRVTTTQGRTDDRTLVLRITHR